MTNYFECRVSYDKTLESGAIKQVTESYLVEAMSFTEAEARITQQMQPYMSGEFSVSAVNRRKYEDVLLDDDRDKLDDDRDKLYHVKLMFITIDEKTAAEKRKPKPSYLLVQARDIADVLSQVEILMSDSVTNYDIVSVSESRILDVFVCNDKAE